MSKNTNKAAEKSTVHKSNTIHRFDEATIKSLVSQMIQDLVKEKGDYLEAKMIFFHICADVFREYGETGLDALMLSGDMVPAFLEEIFQQIQNSEHGEDEDE